jgi:hypothetical protein
LPDGAIHALPPLYAPWRHGRYDVAPGLTRFGKSTAAGDSASDAHVFQFDESFDRFHAAKLASRAKDLPAYVCSTDLAQEVASTVAEFIAGRLIAEHPKLFRCDRSPNETRLHCALTNERLTFDAATRLTDATTAPDLHPPCADALDALACQIQEDLAIVRTDGDRHWLAYAHVCLPNGWAPAEKIGRSFAGIHEPVAGMADMNRRGHEFARIMTAATDGLVRFAWGVTFDDALDHHPDRPRTGFDPGNPRAFVRVERQTIWGFPAVGAAIFTIRTYLYDCASIRRDPTLGPALIAALRSMPPASREYKGLTAAFDELVSWLPADDRP